MVSDTIWGYKKIFISSNSTIFKESKGRKCLKVNQSQSYFKRQGLLECKREEIWSCRWALNQQLLRTMEKEKNAVSFELIQNRVQANGQQPVTWWGWKIQRKTMEAQSYIIDTQLFLFLYIRLYSSRLI